MHADRTNRVALAVLGLILLGMGVTGLLLGAEFFGARAAHRTLVDNDVVRFAIAQRRWLWPAVAVFAIVVALLALRWLHAILFSTGRLAGIRVAGGVAGDRAAGRTTLISAALRDAVSGEIEQYRGVSSARTHVEGNPAHPRLTVTVHADLDADLAGLRHNIEDNALTHARHALDAPALPIRLDVTTARHGGPRVS
ncbi:alkaline shock response membrane anchor protein AmaP [Dactylosporangium sp. CA-139114]|uniref:alkaline shock response membrane anchor protein AmaP n=1 Tax=Dactylosporangium sp. CA-139114 TaxID=3239931 RepID=UPI003D95EB00